MVVSMVVIARERWGRAYANVIPVGSEHADLLLVDNGVQVLELLVRGRRAVELLHDRRVLAALDLLLLK